MIVILFFICTALLQPARILEGKVTDASDQQPLTYVNVGVVGTRYGAVTDSSGYFSIQIKSLPEDALVRFSMVGYKPREFMWKNLTVGKPDVELERKVVEMNEISVSGSRLKEITKGTRSDIKLSVTGWGRNLIGGERGIRIKVDSKPIHVKSMNFHVVNNEFEEVLMRLHIRNFEDDRPGYSLLSEDILIPVREKSGWIRVNLESYGLVFKEDIVVSLQPVDHSGNCREDSDYCFVISLARMKFLSTGWFFYKWSAESEWKVLKNSSPGIYLEIWE